MLKAGGKWPIETELVRIEAVTDWNEVHLEYVPERKSDGERRIGGMPAQVAVRIDDKHLFDRTADQLHDVGFLQKADPTIVAVRMRYREDAEERMSWVLVREERMPSEADLQRLWHGREFEEP